ncbi:MAG: YicC family protein [Flammeovirgaceae bacterium]
MTGFGKANVETDEISLSIEIKTLNSKYQDVSVKMSSNLADKELEIKTMLTNSLSRGKIMTTINFRSKQMEDNVLQLNLPLIQSYYKQMYEAAQLVGADTKDVFRIIMTNFSEVYLKEGEEEKKEKDWQIIKKTLEKAIENCDNFRIHEGKMLEKVLREAIQRISDLIVRIEAKEPERIENVRKRLYQQVKEFVENERFDPNRFEQELIYYIERMDFSEEKTRLRKHLEHFIETLEEVDSNGKKLNFIAQEIGREINTMGAKANDAHIQKWVVEMKDELEKIKEQVLNVV